MKNLYFTILLIFLGLINSNLIAQPFGNGSLGDLTVSSSTVINTYAKVTNVYTTSIQLNANTPSFYNKKAIIIQMEGPNAGTWEWIRVTNVIGNELYLSSAIVNSYNSTDKVQVILVPEYENLTIAAGGILTCLPYNSTTGTCGVLVFNVNQNFVIQQDGFCNVSGKGFSGGVGASGGAGGAGGTGGLAGAFGQNGGNSGIQFNTGISGGGDGGSYGNPGNLGVVASIPSGIGSGAPASNLSTLSSSPTHLILGGAGKSGNGGAGKAGAGGGGGGAGTTGSQNGTDGAIGASGGNGGNGGNGGGIILFAARTLNVISSQAAFIANGTNGLNGTNGVLGGVGGNGGVGIDCNLAGGGGGGRGGDGANGGNGGNGGAGGTVYGYLPASSSQLTASHLSLSGGNGATAGSGGQGGQGGLNAGTLSGSCPPIINGPYFDTLISGPTSNAICSLENSLDIVSLMGVNGANNGTYSFLNGIHSWESPNGNYLRLVEMYAGMNQGMYLIYGMNNGIEYYANIIDSDHFGNFVQAVNDLFSIVNQVTYTSTLNNQIGVITNLNEHYYAKCGYTRSEPEDGTDGSPGEPGLNASTGVWGSGTPQECTGGFNFTITDDIYLFGASIFFNIPGLTFDGTFSNSNGTVPVSGSDLLSFPIVVGSQTNQISGTLTNACGDQIVINETYFTNLPPACDYQINYSIIQDATCTSPALIAVEIQSSDQNTPVNAFWSDGGQSDSQTNNGLSISRYLGPGNYQVSFTNNINCFGITADIIVPEPSIPIINYAEVSQLSCVIPNGGAGVTLSVSGGTEPYTYFINNMPFGVDGDLTGLGSGVFSYSVIDANGCVAAGGGSFEIYEQVNPSMSINVIQPNCQNSTGTMEITSITGAYPFYYVLNNDYGMLYNSSFENLSSGFYSFSISDQNGCQSNTQNFDIVAYTPMTLTSNIIQPTCGNINGGQIQVNVSGGNAPYQYVWNTGATTASLSNIGSGNYSVTVTDAMSCTLTENQTIASISSLSANAQITQPNCPGDLGSINVQISQGTAPFSYNIGNGWTSSSVFQNLQAGNYTIDVLDATGCTITLNNIAINTVDSLQIQATILNEICNGANGEVDLTILNPSSTYSVMWNNGSPTFGMSHLQAGVYTATITDLNNCVTTYEVTVGSQTNTLIIDSTISQITCFGLANGEISLSISGGIPSYFVNWGFTTGATITNLVAGSYVANITDAAGCSTSASFTITQPNQIIVNATVQNPTCFGGCNGNITLQQPNGVSITNALWSPSSNPNSINQTNLCAGNYSVELTTDEGCVIKGNYTISNPAPMVVNLSAQLNNPCLDSYKGTITIKITGGTAPYTYVWSNGATSNSISNLPNGNYTVTVTDALGCTSTATYTITSASQLQANVIGNLMVCDGQTTQITVNPFGGIPPYVGGGTFVLGVSNNVYSIKDAAGCIVNQTVNIGQYPFSKFEINHINTCEGQSNGSVTLTETTVYPPLTFLWSNGATTQSITNLPVGTYSVTVTDGNGCTTQFSSYVDESIPPSLNANVTNAMCSPLNSGSIAINLNGMYNPNDYTYLWSNGATTYHIDSITAGQYTVTVTDLSGCSVTKTLEVADGCVCPYNFNVSICGPDVVCQGENFTFTSNVFPRAQGYPYTYVWTTPLGTTFTTASMSVTGAALTSSGWYHLDVHYGANCVASSDIYLTVRPRPVATISNSVTGFVDNYIHMRGCDIQLTAGGGVYYNWTIATTAVPTNHTNELLYPTTTTSAALITYKVIAVDSFGCSSLQVQHRVRTANPNITRSLNTSGTNPNLIRTLTLNQAQILTNATYYWSVDNNPWSATTSYIQRQGTFAQLAGVYTLQIDQAGCMRSYSFSLSNTGVFTPIVYNAFNKQILVSDQESNEQVQMKNSQFEIKLYPIPANDEATIEIQNENNDYIGLVIYDFSGRVIRDMNVGTEPIIKLPLDMSSYARGLYFLQYSLNGIPQEEKIKFMKE
jgi:hypothetical protein